VSDLSSENPGFLLIDKSSGMTSHDVVNIVRRQTGVKRVGHAGTLDPLATGLLIVLVGRSNTKLQSHFLHMDKEYITTAQLGVTTDTYDAEGKVLSSAEWPLLQTITELQVQNVVNMFRGEISQRVPAYSAVKRKGKKLYQLAREGKIVLDELPIRIVIVKELSMESFQKDPVKRTIFFSLKISCSSGTYIRSLVHDIGQKLVAGATVTQLRRTQIGHYSVNQAKPLSLI